MDGCGRLIYRLENDRITTARWGDFKLADQQIGEART